MRMGRTPNLKGGSSDRGKWLHGRQGARGPQGRSRVATVCNTSGVSLALASCGRERNQAHLHAGHQGHTGHLPLFSPPPARGTGETQPGTNPLRIAPGSATPQAPRGAGITPLHGPSLTCHGKLMVPKKQQMGTRNISSVQTITLSH